MRGRRTLTILLCALSSACSVDHGAQSNTHPGERFAVSAQALANAAIAPEPQASPSPLPLSMLAHKQGMVRIVVQLGEPAQSDDAARAAEVARRQERTLAQLPAAEFRLVRRYGLVSAMAGLASAHAIETLRTLPDVTSLVQDQTVETQLAQSAALVQAPLAAKQWGVTGKGVRVAVVDSGVDATHPDLAGQVVAQHCSATGACSASGADTGPLALDDNGHGTHVASIIAGKGLLAAPGIAPASQIVAVRVLGKKGTGFASDIVAGLDWVAQNASKLQIRVVNLSLGSQAIFGGACDAADPATAQVVKLLIAKKVAVFAAAGNGASLAGLSSPACVSGVIALGAVYDANVGPRSYPGLCKDPKTAAGQMACFSNRSPGLELVAPGAIVTAAAPGAKTVQMSGTSQASPVAAGVAALVLSCQPKATPSSLRTLLRMTGKAIVDPATGKTRRLVQALSAVQAACPK